MAAITGRGIAASASSPARMPALTTAAAPSAVNSDTSAPAANAFSLPVTTTAFTDASAVSRAEISDELAEQRGRQRVERRAVEAQQRHPVGARLDEDQRFRHACLLPVTWRS